MKAEGTIMPTFVEQIVAQVSAALRDGLSRAMAGQTATRGTRPEPMPRTTAVRARSAQKGRNLDMGCRVARCRNRSKGPRFHFMCEEHVRLPKRKQLAALEAWKAK